MAQGKPLTEHERAKVIAYYLHGYGQRSIAKILGYDRMTVRAIVLAAGVMRTADDGYSIWRRGT